MRVPAAGIPTYGAEQTTWAGIQRALRKLGATHVRYTGGHNYVLMELPDGTRIKAGRPEGSGKRGDTVVKRGIQEVLGALGMAGVAPPLFLALLDEHGDLSWHRGRRPREVEKYMAWLKTNPNLANPEQWEPAWEEPAAAPVVAPHEAPQAAEWVPVPLFPEVAVPEALSEPQPPALRYTTADLAELLGYPKGHPYRGELGNWVSDVLRRSRDSMAHLLASGDAHLDKEGRRRGRYLFSEAGMLAMAEAAERLFAKERGEVSPVKQEEAEHDPALLVAAEHLAEAINEQRAALPPAMGPGEALLYLCDYFGVRPVFEDYTLDVGATLSKLARAAHEMGGGVRHE
jgi:hypothetical protein